jgi:hypothetical protein
MAEMLKSDQIGSRRTADQVLWIWQAASAALFLLSWPVAFETDPALVPQRSCVWEPCRAVIGRP